MSSVPPKVTEEEAKNAEIIARQDRIPIWALSYLFIGILGIGYVFVFFDIFNINATFIQTALTLGWATSPTSTTIANLESFVVLVNLIGYVVGALILSPLSDRFGRREMLIVTLLITGLGSIFNALVSSYALFAAARFITGLGIGADLAIVNSYLNEVAPKNGRARYTSFLFVLAGIGVVLAIWLGIIFDSSRSIPQWSSIRACSIWILRHKWMESNVRHWRHSCVDRRVASIWITRIDKVANNPWETKRSRPNSY